MHRRQSFTENKQYQLLCQFGDMLEQAILVVDESGNILFSNRVAHTLFTRPDEIYSEVRISDIFLTPSVVEILQKNLGKLQKGTPWSGNFLVKFVDGTKTWITVYAMIIAGEKQKIFTLVCQTDDTIPLKQVTTINHILTGVIMLLDEGGDYTDNISALAKLFIPEFADWCSIHLLQPDGVLEKMAIAPDNVLQDQSVYNWFQNDLPNNESDGLLAVLQKGKSVINVEVNSIRRASEAGIKSYMIVPLTMNQKTMGMITFVRAQEGRSFDSNSVALAENMAVHIAALLQTSQLYQQSQKVNQVLHQRQIEDPAELEETLSRLKRSEDVIQGIFRVSNKLNATLDIDVILDTLALEAIKMVNGESGFAGLRTGDGMVVRKYFQGGTATPFDHSWKLGEGVPGWVLKYKVPYGTSDAANDPLIQNNLAINANVQSIICTPILDSIGEVIAYFDIRNKKGAEGFSINDQEMLLTLAPVASIAIQNAIAYHQRQLTVAELQENARQLRELASGLESAREEERKQIARELHDELGQTLTAMKLDLAWLSEQLRQKDEVLSQKSKEITSQLNTLIKIVRRIATRLRPGMLDDLGLIASIEWQAHDFEKHSGIKCQLNLDDTNIKLDNEQKLAIFRIFQEALTNVARYAEAKNVEVKLHEVDEFMTLEVHDDGRGIKEGDRTGLQSLGLIGMRERAERLGGSFDIQGQPGKGTTLVVTIPINNKTVDDNKEKKDAQNPDRR
jgi:signal transduction histidine kinase